MSFGSSALTPPAGVSPEEFDRLLEQGRARRALSVDDVMAVLKHVELSEDVIEGVRRRLSDEGIVLDEGEVELNGADLVPPEEPPGTVFAVPQPATPPAGAGAPAFLPAPPVPPVARPARRPPTSPVGDDAGGRAEGGRGSAADPVRTYLKEIGKVNLLSGAEEV